MRLRFKCGCGMYNYNWGDWISHYKYGGKGIWHAVWLFLNKRIEIN